MTFPGHPVTIAEFRKGDHTTIVDLRVLTHGLRFGVRKLARDLDGTLPKATESTSQVERVLADAFARGWQAIDPRASRLSSAWGVLI